MTSLERARSIVDGVQGVARIQLEVHDDLLQLNAVGLDCGQGQLQLGEHGDPLPPQLVGQKRDHVLNHRIEVHVLDHRGSLPEQ